MSAHIRTRRDKDREVDVEQPLLPKEGSIDTVEDDDSGKLSKPRQSRGMLLALYRLVPLLGLTLVLAAFNLAGPGYDFPWPSPSPQPLPPFIQDGIAQCKIIARPPPSPSPFNHKRTESDRFVPGTGDVLLKNATLWTGEEDGEQILRGVDVLLSGGVIKSIGSSSSFSASTLKHAEVVELHGSWVTPGIVDMHSHMGVDAAPGLRGSDDTNSLKAPILPWLRSLDGFNTHDLAFNLSISGGITTMLVLPGSAGNIGGQAFAFKPRWTKENTPGSMQVEPPFVIHHGRGPNGTEVQTWERTRAWRHIKHACGENPARVYGNTRMDSAYDFRRAYTEGKKLKDEQDRWCASPSTQTSPFPTSLEWEALADVIRGNVKVNIHCYETTDLNSMVRISNEFQFPIAAFHHAHETYLVPDLLKAAWGPTPAVALFATNARYKREAYRGSEFAPRLLADAGIRVSMKSDHPVLDSRYLVYEAAQAHHYGLNASHALASVTTHSAISMGVDHRLGYVRVGYDADVVVWDSFPLSLGATPKQVYIDGIPQIIDPHVVDKPEEAQQVTPAGEWDEEAAEAVASRGDPDLRPKRAARNVVFANVAEYYLSSAEARVGGGAGAGAQVQALAKGDRVVVTDGEVVCVGQCVMSAEEMDAYEMVDLKGGSVTPGLITVGSNLGVVEIDQEKSTWDGPAYDPLSGAAPLLDGILNHGVDGLSLGGKDELYAYRSGVTLGLAAPLSSSLISGLSFSFSPGAPHPLAPGAIPNPSAALHLSFSSRKLASSTKLAVLRRLLTQEANNDTEAWEVLREVKRGERRVVIRVDKADEMAGIVRLKREVAPGMKIAFLGGAESWLIADDLAREDIGVIVAPARSWPTDWNSRRTIPGPPLSNLTLPAYLTSRGVLVGLGITEEWQARNTRNDAAWVYANNPDVFTRAQALDLVGNNLEVLLGLQERKNPVPSGAEEAALGVGTTRSGTGWVAWEGDWTGFGGRVRAVKGVGGEEVHLF